MIEPEPQHTGLKGFNALIGCLIDYAEAIHIEKERAAALRIFVQLMAPINKRFRSVEERASFFEEIALMAEQRSAKRYGRFGLDEGDSRSSYPQGLGCIDYLVLLKRDLIPALNIKKRTKSKKNIVSLIIERVRNLSEQITGRKKNIIYVQFGGNEDTSESPKVYYGSIKVIDFSVQITRSIPVKPRIIQSGIAKQRPNPSRKTGGVNANITTIG